MGAIRTYNPYTNREVEIIRAHWTTRMPLSELVALLPRHSEYSITNYANRILGLKRPTWASAPGSPRKQPAWDRVRALLGQRPMTHAEIAEQCGFSRTRASEIMRAHPGEVYIEDWRPMSTEGRFEALWALGNKQDAPIPAGAKFGRRGKRVNPFDAAAGLVQIPTGQTGRIFVQDMTGESMEDRRKAA
jgi:hypothetical protein